MPIYFVRWPDFSASFVQADGEEHLLDQVGNPDDCEWNIYEGSSTSGYPWSGALNHHSDDCGQPPAVDGDEPGT